jgi:hypothetical protein
MRVFFIASGFIVAKICIFPFCSVFSRSFFSFLFFPNKASATKKCNVEIAKYGNFGRFWAVFKLFSLNSPIFLAIASYGREAAIGGGEMCLWGAIRPSGRCEMLLAMWWAGCSGAARSGCTATGQGACSVCFESK